MVPGIEEAALPRPRPKEHIPSDEDEGQEGDNGRFQSRLHKRIEEGMRRGLTSKWSKPYPKLVSLLLGKDDSMFRFYEFPKAMWKSIYTSNAAESLNATAKRKTRARIQYNSEDSALIVLAKVYEDYNRNARPARFMLEMSEEEKKEMGFNV